MEVTIYTMPTCKMSSWMKTVFINKGIRFREKNFLNYKLDNNLVADLKAPLIGLGSDVLIAFDIAALKEMENSIINKIEEY